MYAGGSAKMGIYDAIRLILRGGLDLCQILPEADVLRRNGQERDESKALFYGQFRSAK